MPGQALCPIPEVDRALASFINCREDTLKIRQTLANYLAACLRPVSSATQSHHLNHECPQNLSATNTNPPGLKDSRLDYLHALRAKCQAQIRHRNLQESLKDLQTNHVDENPTQPESEYDNEVTRGYISLIRQRRRFAELQVVQESFDKLLTAKPSNAFLDPRDRVKTTIGEQPDLPAERMEQISQAQDDQTWLFKLKQEVLGAKTSMERAQAAKEKAQSESRGSSSLQGQISALECARDEMVEWIQGELAKLEEDSIFLEDASPIKRSTTVANHVDLQSSETRIQESYNRYVSSRANLLGSHSSLDNGPQMQGEEDRSVDAATISDKLNEMSKSSLPVTKLLPHLPRFSQISKNERSLLQQSVFLETQIGSADQAVEDSLLRLSGESHLLPAGSKGVAAWGKTASESESATEDFIQKRLQESQHEISSVSTAVELCSLQSEILTSV